LIRRRATSRTTLSPTRHKDNTSTLHELSRPLPRFPSALTRPAQSANTTFRGQCPDVASLIGVASPQDLEPHSLLDNQLSVPWIWSASQLCVQTYTCFNFVFKLTLVLN
jgi:hypothetical protein